PEPHAAQVPLGLVVELLYQVEHANAAIAVDRKDGLRHGAAVEVGRPDASEPRHGEEHPTQLRRLATDIPGRRQFTNLAASSADSAAPRVAPASWTDWSASWCCTVSPTARTGC